VTETITTVPVMETVTTSISRDIGPAVPEDFRPPKNQRQGVFEINREGVSPLA
jgi:hypothetical protein